MAENRRKKISFILRHVLYSSIIYYILAVFTDIISGGAVSFFFQINLLLGVALASATALAWIGGDTVAKDEADSPNKRRWLFLGLIAIIGLLLFIALLPHDTLAAVGISLLTVGLLYSIREHIL